MAEKITSFYNRVKEFHKSETWPACELDSEKLSATLRPYQEDAVKWMLSREKGDKQSTLIGDEVVEYPQGGILADEMGLGKTVEVLALILNNPCVEKIEHDIKITPKPRPQKRPIETTKPALKNKKQKVEGKTGINQAKYTALREWYESCLAGQKVYHNPEESSIQCFCTSTPKRQDLIQCLECGTEQHLDCVCVDEEFQNYICPKCWIKKEPIKSRTTLIISPSSISDQWISEIKKHVKDPDFRIHSYEGIKGRNYIQPVHLAKYDVVLTTYQVLSKELDYTEETSQRRLRHAKRYHAPVTPLTCISWWRICLDEAQMVEGSASKAAMMVRNFETKYRWAVSGTPIQKSLQDLFGLIQFLKIDPLSTQGKFSNLMDDEREFESFMAPILWRNMKRDVFHMLEIPEQKSVLHMFHFSPVEGYFYQMMHSECSESFLEKLSKFDDLDVPIKSVDRHTLNKTLMPLLKLRQACIHPQVIKGKYGKFKHTMSMEELMDEMVMSAKIEVDSALRSMVSSLNGLAGIYLIEKDYGNAVTSYRKVLSLDKDFEHITKIDTLQKIHALHNLALTLEEHNAGTYESLRIERNELEEKYMKKSEQLLMAAIAAAKKISESIELQCEGRTIGFTDWWEKVINWSESEDLLNRINSRLEDDIHLKSKTMDRSTLLSRRLTSLPNVFRELAKWLADVDLARIKSLDALKGLLEIQKENLSQQALACHLGQKQTKQRSFLCQLCEVHKVLKKYEMLIFSLEKKPMDIRKNRFLEFEEAAEELSSNKDVLELQQAEVFLTKEVGNWKPTQHENVLRVLASFAKGKRAPSDWVEDSVKHLSLLDSIRKEFKLVRTQWRMLANNISAIDELSMAKQRLRLPTPEEYEKRKEPGQKEKNPFVITPLEIPLQAKRYEFDMGQAERRLKRTCGILVYLKNLQKNGSDAVDQCPVCFVKLETQWSVLQCAHCLCFECIERMLKMSPYNEIECPVCRLKSVKAEIAFVSSKIPGNMAQVGGTYSSKVKAVVDQVMRLKVDDMDVKILIFSSWDKTLDVIGNALMENSVSFRRLKSDKTRKLSLSQFKNGAVTALLMLLASGSKGLNITEATHVFLVEPILNPADELQAVGRVHRIGQTKQTYVHRFIIKNTVEESMLSTVDSNSWADGGVTLRELYGLFRLQPQKVTAKEAAMDALAEENRCQLAINAFTVDSQAEPSHHSSSDSDMETQVVNEHTNSPSSPT